MIISPQSSQRNLEGVRVSLACGDALLEFAKWKLCGIRVLFRTHFVKLSKGIHLSLRVPFFASFLGIQERRSKVSA